MLAAAGPESGAGIRATDVMAMSDGAAELYGVPPGARHTREYLRQQIHPADRDRARFEAQRASRERTDYLIDDALRTLLSPAEITAAAAQALGEHPQVNRCAYAFVEDDEEDAFMITGNYTLQTPLPS